MTTYIAGYDGSDTARAALRFTRDLAANADADVLAAAVYPQSRFAAGGDAGDQAARPGREEAERTLGASGVPEVTHVAVGAPSPAEGLHRLAEDQDAALLAVGTTHRGSVGRVIPGSVADHLLHGAPCPIAVVPATYAGGSVRTVAVAYDERPESNGALAAAEQFARRLRARLVVIAVHEQITAAYGVDDDLAERLEAELGRVVDGIEGIETEDRFLRGPAAETIVDAVHDADVLVMGSRGYGPVRGVLLGSVSHDVVDHAPCPVVVVPRGVEGDVLGDT